MSHTRLGLAGKRPARLRVPMACLVACLIPTASVYAQEASFSNRLSIAESFVGARDIVLADIDGDLDLDIVSAALSERHIAWWENSDGAGRWIYHEVVHGDPSLAEPGEIAAGDIDGDGDTDIVATFVATGRVVWFDNLSSDGDIWAIREINDGSLGVLDTPLAVEAADLDGDGDLDVVISVLRGDGGGADIVVWLNEAPGQGQAADGSIWTPIVVTTAFDGAAVLRLADIDHDGHIDIVAASESSGLAWWSNTAGNGTVWTPTPITSAISARAIELADLDDDGDLDIVVANRSGGTLTWWENTAGDGSAWEVHTIASSYPGASAVHVADLDGNGTLDIVAGRSVRSGGLVTGAIHWWEVTLPPSGEVVLSPPYVLDANAGGVSSFASTDVDGDGDLDLVTTSDDGAASPASDLAWYINRTNAAPPRIVSIHATGPTRVRVQFSEAMLDNAALTAPANYTVTPSLQVMQVTLPVAGDTSLVELATQEMLHGQVYTLTVPTAGGPTSVQGMALAAGQNAALFDGVGEAPTVTLLGDDPTVLDVNTPYVEAGATAVDNVDGDLTASIVVTGSVDTSRPGEYSLTYSATDAAGNTGTAVRTVVVRPTGPNADINGDGRVDSVDIQLVINAVLGLDIGPYADAADVNRDAQVNSVDIQLVINAVLGIG